MELTRRLRAGRTRPIVADQAAFYEGAPSADDIRRWQLDRFNDLWAGVRTRVPHYRALSRQCPLPERFASWEELRALMPVMERATVQSRVEALMDPERPPDFWRSTGGSTAEPLRTPGWKTEIAATSADAWYARGWFGVTPADRLFLLWGHSHLLGDGWSGRVNALRRQLKDRLVGYHRSSAYDLSEAGLRRAAEELLSFRPSYVLGYAVALDRFARVNAERQPELHSLRMKVAIATAEAFPSAESASMVSDILGCPVAMEYGAVETGMIAHQTIAGDYRVFWRHLAVEAVPSERFGGQREILITSLHQRCMPLIRYRLGDVIETEGADDGPLIALKRVVGRCNDYVQLPGGDTVHSEAFSHAVKEIPAISGFQVVQRSDGEIRLHYLAARPLSQGEVDAVRRRLSRVHRALGATRIVRTDRLDQTVAGKLRPIRREGA